VSWLGLLLVDKPEGPTSHDIVAVVRRATGERRIGHTGTLDPLATGLLPLAIGPVTRLIQFLPHSPKTYVGTLLLGQTSDTDDISGQTTTRHEGTLPGTDAIAESAAALTGSLSQRPPDFSARKVGGQRLYRLARRGVEVEAPERSVQVDRFQLDATDDPARFRFEAVVSAGTYIRSLVRDLGADLGCGAVMESLRRTAIGPLKIADALSWEGVPDPAALRDGLVAPSDLPLELPRTGLADAEDCRRFRLGQPIHSSIAGSTEGQTAVLDPSGRLLGVAEWQGPVLKPRLVLPEAP